MDDVLRGQLPDNELINEFVSFVESFIIVAGRFSILHALFLPSNRQEAERLREAQRRAIKALDEEPRRRFLAYRRDFVRLIVERLFIGSLTGWLFLAMLFPLVALTFVYRLIQRASISVTDLIISVNRAMSRLRRTDADLGWSLFAGKIVTMRDMSGRTKSLAECAA